MTLQVHILKARVPVHITRLKLQLFVSVALFRLICVTISLLLFCFQGLTNGFSANQCYNGYTGMHNGSRSNGHNGVHCTSSSDSGEDEEPTPTRREKTVSLRTLRRSSKITAESEAYNIQRPLPSPVVKSSPQPSSLPKACSVLDRLIKKLPNFDGMNHPFRTEVEKETERARVKHFEARVAFLTKEYAGELAAFKLAQAAKENGSSALPQEKPPPGKTSNSPPQKQRRGVKRKRLPSQEPDPTEKDSVRRSKRTRMSAERYQHLLDSFPRHMPKPDPSEGPTQRWKWLSVVDQLRYGEKFQIQARRITPQGKVEFLLHWDDDDLRSGSTWR